MDTSSFRVYSTIGAFVVAGLFVAAAFLATEHVSLKSTTTVDARSTDKELKAYSSVDTDSDGLPDWKEVLYATDPKNPHSFDEKRTDGEAVAEGLIKPRFTADPEQITKLEGEALQEQEATIPGADPVAGGLTDRLAKEFFTKFIDTSGGKPLTEEGEKEVLTDFMDTLSEEAGQTLVSKYGAHSLKIVPSADVRSYASAVEAALRAHEVPEESANPFRLIKEMYESNDASASQKLAVLADAQENLTLALLEISVPSKLSDEHLTLIQVTDSLGKASRTIANKDRDPLAVIPALAVYPSLYEASQRALQAIAVVITTDLGEPLPGSPGALILEIARSAPRTDI